MLRVVHVHRTIRGCPVHVNKSSSGVLTTNLCCARVYERMAGLSLTLIQRNKALICEVNRTVCVWGRGGGTGV